MRKKRLVKSRVKWKNRGYRCKCLCHRLKTLLKGIKTNLYREVSCRDAAGDEGISQYTIYCIVNGSYFTNKGNLTASVARSFLRLFNKVDANRTKSSKLWDWEESGEKLIVLDGVNHGHLRYLAEEMHYAAVATDLLYQKWGKSKIILVLSVLGRFEDLEEILDGLDSVR